MRRIPCVLMRGGTSRGPVFLAADLPQDMTLRDAVLISAMGSPNALQIDGIGGGHPLTSKVAIVGPSNDGLADIDYEFVQVITDRAAVDRKPNCGNMLSAAAPYAIEAGLVTAHDPETTLRVRNINSGTIVDVVVQTPGGVVQYEGMASIDGVPGSAAPIRLLFAKTEGIATGSLFPTGATRQAIDGLSVTLIDGAIPVVIMQASELGLRGDEAPMEIDADPVLLARIEAVRLQAGTLMGLGNVAGQVTPKVAILGRAIHGHTLGVRYLTPARCHKALAVTGAVTLALAIFAPGTIAADLAQLDGSGRVGFEHPEGVLDIEVDTERKADGQLVVQRMSTLRTARRIFEGNLLLPSFVWP